MRKLGKKGEAPLLVVRLSAETLKELKRLAGGGRGKLSAFARKALEEVAAGGRRNKKR